MKMKILKYSKIIILIIIIKNKVYFYKLLYIYIYIYMMWNSLSILVIGGCPKKLARGFCLPNQNPTELILEKNNQNSFEKNK